MCIMKSLLNFFLSFEMQILYRKNIIFLKVHLKDHYLEFRFHFPMKTKL